MLEVKNLTIKIGNNRTLIDNLSFALNKGDKIAIIGEEGNGKTTLFNAIADRSVIEEYAQINGQINYVNERIGYLRQMLDLSWNEKLVKEYFAGYEDFVVYKVFSRLQLSVDILLYDQRIGTLSGGEKIKLQLAKLLLDEPTILLLDEPSNDLDINMLEWLEDFILKAREGIIFISHDEVLLEKCANKILHLEQLKHKTEAKWSFENMTYVEYKEMRSAKIEKQNQIAYKQREQDNLRQERWQRIYNIVEHEQETISRRDPHGARLLKKKMKAVKSQEKRFEREREEFLEFIKPEEAITVKFKDSNISIKKIVLDEKFDEIRAGEKILFKNLHLKIVGPEKIVIIGKNGIGKSTLIKEIYKRLSDNSMLKIGYMPQNYDDKLYEYKNVMDYLEDNVSTHEQLSFVITMLSSLKLTKEEIFGDTKKLSGGSKAKLFLAKLMADEPDILILDEPTRNLSPLSSPVLRNALKNYTGAIISVSHDRKFIKGVATKVLELNKDGFSSANLNNYS